MWQLSLCRANRRNQWTATGFASNRHIRLKRSKRKRYWPNSRWFSIFLSACFLLLPTVFNERDALPWRWPEWGKIVGLIGVCLYGWICISCVITLGKRRFNNWRLGLGPYSVWLMQGLQPHQPLKLRIHQQTRRPVSIERLDVSLICVETETTLGVDLDNYNSASVRDRELWSNTKTSALESQSFSTDCTIETSTEFAIPEVPELHRRRDGDEVKGSGWETTRHFQWRVRIETYLTDGHATKALFCLTKIADDPARPDTGIVATDRPTL